MAFECVSLHRFFASHTQVHPSQFSDCHVDLLIVPFKIVASRGLFGDQRCVRLQDGITDSDKVDGDIGHGPLDAWDGKGFVYPCGRGPQRGTVESVKVGEQVAYVILGPVEEVGSVHGDGRTICHLERVAPWDQGAVKEGHLTPRIRAALLGSKRDCLCDPEAAPGNYGKHGPRWVPASVDQFELQEDDRADVLSVWCRQVSRGHLPQTLQSLKPANL